MLAFSNDYYGFIFRVTQSVELFCTYEESPVALILCAEKSQETIELMQLDHGNIHVGQYMTKMPPKELLVIPCYCKCERIVRTKERRIEKFNNLRKA